MATLKEIKKAIGKKIVKIEYPRYWDEYRGSWLHDPVIILEDGSRLFFTVEEGSAEYGVSIGINVSKESK